MALFERRKVNLEKVFALEIEELKQLGYYSFQIKDILNQTVNGKKIKQLSLEEEEQIRQILIKHINFAKKALNNTHKDG